MKIAAHLGVRDRDRPARLDLLEEARHDAAVAAEHVAEPHGHEARAAARVAIVLNDQLGDALGGAHDARWIDGLVGGDQDEALDAVPLGRLAPRVACR